MAFIDCKMNLKSIACILFFVILICFNSLASAAHVKPIQKRNNFVEIGCLGLFDNAKYNRLERICEECYSVTRTLGVESSCKANCFRNSEFLKCIDLLLYTNQKNELNEMAQSLYGSYSDN